MRIAFLITSLANKGPIIMLRALVQQLIQKEGYHCKVYYFDALTDLEFDCEVKQISFFDPIEFHAYDLIHSHLFRPDLYCLFHSRKIRKSKVKLVSTIHTAIYDDLAFTYSRFIANLLIPPWKLAWKKMDHVVVLTQAAKNYYHKTKFKAVSVISNGINIPSPMQKVPEADLAELLAFKKITSF
ncbi:glycosyltransferase family 4 protein [Pedobacter sp. P26]|uniref:glycosyltransferase family 4 protein n=1 Tax=Pedobacter sp. P26 TaxID=3423956 RepID=UPI003D67F502